MNVFKKHFQSIYFKLSLIYGYPSAEVKRPAVPVSVDAMVLQQSRKEYSQLFYSVQRTYVIGQP